MGDLNGKEEVACKVIYFFHCTLNCPRTVLTNAVIDLLQLPPPGVTTSHRASWKGKQPADFAGC